MNFFSRQTTFTIRLSLLAAAMLVLLWGSCSVHSLPLPIESFDQNCGTNAYWTPHGTYCPPNCANRGLPGPCIKLFVPSCQCLVGFVFTGDNKTGDCVRLVDCTFFNSKQQQQQQQL